MSRRYVDVTRTRQERRVPRKVKPREAVGVLCEHLGVRLELAYLCTMGPPAKQITVVPDKEAE